MGQSSKRQLHAILRRVLERKKAREARLQRLADEAADEEAALLRRAVADLDTPSYANPPFACPPDGEA